MKRPTFSITTATLGALALATGVVHGRASAKELDQFTDRLQVLRYYGGGYRDIAGAPGPERVDAVLDGRMNELLDELEHDLNDDRPETLAERDARVRHVFQHRYLPELVTPYEEWVKHDAYVPLYKVRDKGILRHRRRIRRLAHDLVHRALADHPGRRRADRSRQARPLPRAGLSVLRALSVAPHWLDRGRALPALREYGHQQEFGQLGIATGGVYSFADLASNWAGMIFFLALFDDANVEGDAHARYFERRADGSYHRVRDFHWAEWVSSDWDEALNPAALEKRTLFEKVSANLRRHPGPPTAHRTSICDDYRADPNAYLGPRRQLRPRTRYALPERAAGVAPYALDVRAICRDRP